MLLIKFRFHGKIFMCLYVGLCKIQDLLLALSPSIDPRTAASGQRYTPCTVRFARRADLEIRDAELREERAAQLVRFAAAVSARFAARSPIRNPSSFGTNLRTLVRASHCQSRSIDVSSILTDRQLGKSMKIPSGDLHDKSATKAV